MGSLFGDSTGNATVSWQPEPKFRGTWGVVSACLATLLLCTWTAVHLNIPAPRRPTTQAWRKIGWMLVGLLAPEMVVFTAWTQNRSSNILHKSMIKVLRQPAPPTTWQNVRVWPVKTWASICQTPGAIHRWSSKTIRSIINPSAPSPWPIGISSYRDESKPLVEMYHLSQMDDVKLDGAEAVPQPVKGHRVSTWTKTHSWYAVMGGFYIDMRHLPRGFIPGSPSFQTLSTEGLLLLARCKPEILPDISREEIMDKSKTDGFKKFMICVQATWFLVSTMFRLSKGYPIALLELNTFAHALCALFVYIIWWSKPLDVAGPTLIDARLCKDLVAFLAMASNYTGRREMELFRYQPEMASSPRVRFDLNSSPNAPADLATSTKFENDNGAVSSSSTSPPINIIDPENALQVPESSIVLQMGQTLHGFCFERGNEISLPSSNSDQKQPCIVLNAADILRWSHASEFTDRFLKHQEAGQPCIDFQGDSANPELNPDRVPSLLMDRAQNWPTNIISFTRFQAEHISTHVAFTLSNVFYGGLHLVAINAPFQNKMEYSLWLLSSAGLCASGPGALLGLYANFSRDWLNRTKRYRNPDGLTKKETAWNKFLNMGLFLPHIHFFYFYLPTLAVALLFARVFLIVESFMNLSHLDPKVFAIPSWTAYFPHVN